MKNKLFLIIPLLMLAAALSSFLQREVKVGIIGLDTSHSTAFTKLLNAPDKDSKYKGFRIVAAYPYGSKSIKSSYDRIPAYTGEVKKYGVEMVHSIAELLKKVDVVLLETNDGNLHLEQAAEVFASGKKVFIDKPLGASLAQSIAIYDLAEKNKVPVFSSSALRFAEKNQELRNGKYGKIIGADCFSPAAKEPSHPDFSWYGIHGVETLFTIMGTGCAFVNRMSSDSMDVVVGKWNDGRIGTFRGKAQGKSIYGGMALTANEAIPVGGYSGYGGLLEAILTFFTTGVPPVSKEETLEIFTFMEASNESKRNGGKIISMQETYKKGQQEAKKLIKNLRIK